MTRPAPRMDRRALFASGAAAALLAATGVSAAASPRRGGRLRMALSGAKRSDTWDTRNPHGLFMQVATAGVVFDTLTEVAADGTLRGELATGWQGSADARVWEFDLRPGVRFHNGAPFTARDVAASLELHRRGALAQVVAIEALSRHKLRITLAQGDADLPFALSDPRFIIYPADPAGQALTDGIGTGLYRVTRFHPGQQVLAARVADHYKDGRAGWFDTVELVSVPAASVRAEALRDRYVDVADLTDPDALGETTDIALLPQAHGMTHAVWRTVALPGVVGARAPLDNLRAAERWWRA